MSWRHERGACKHVTHGTSVASGGDLSREEKGVAIASLHFEDRSLVRESNMMLPGFSSKFCPLLLN